jgi:hypothetical protein
VSIDGARLALLTIPISRGWAVVAGIAVRIGVDVSIGVRIRHCVGVGVFRAVWFLEISI